VTWILGFFLWWWLRFWVLFFIWLNTTSFKMRKSRSKIYLGNRLSKSKSTPSSNRLKYPTATAKSTVQGSQAQAKKYNPNNKQVSTSSQYGSCQAYQDTFSAFSLLNQSTLS
jgi:hypothetical protein